MAYTTQLIAAQPQTRNDRNNNVHQQEPSTQDLPAETFLFTTAIDFVLYYAVQREIISQLLAILAEFGPDHGLTKLPDPR